MPTSTTLSDLVEAGLEKGMVGPGADFEIKPATVQHDARVIYMPPRDGIRHPNGAGVRKPR